MRVLVDMNRCQAYAQCCFLAPDVFELRGREVLFASPEADPAQAAAVRRAAAACPVQAILINDGRGDTDDGAAQ